MTDSTDMSRREAEFLLYQAEDGRTRVEVRFDGETAWLSLGQMAELFQRDKSVISRHIKNAFEEGELPSHRGSHTTPTEVAWVSAPSAKAAPIVKSGREGV